MAWKDLAPYKYRSAAKSSALNWARKRPSVDNVFDIAVRLVVSSATTTFFGDTGLWFVPTGEVLAHKKWSVSGYRRGTNWVQGYSNVADFAATFGVGIKDRAEIFGSFLVASAESWQAESPERSRWERMDDEVAACAGYASFLDAVVCDQRARHRYCDEWWGRSDACASGRTADYGN